MSRSATPTDNWYKLDNAARVFAAIASRRNTTVFRVAVTLRTPVDRDALQEALDAVMPRFPYFRVRLRKGLFWHYLAQIPATPDVQAERRPPCRRMTPHEDGPFQFRVLVFDRRISLECSHVLTDGTGALAFLNALLAQYLTTRGVDIPTHEHIMRPAQEPHHEEAEDAYRRFYDPRIPPPPLGSRAHRLRGTPLPPDECRVVTGIVPLVPLREIARKHAVTLTELLTSILLAAVDDVVHRPRKPLAVMTPVNLRRFYPSRTMRNFFLSVIPAIDPRLGTHTFEEILHSVHHAVQGQVNEKSISQQIRRNVGAERNVFIRHIPLFIKVQAKRRLYTRRWGTRYTTVLSNLGPLKPPAPMAEQIERFELIPNPSAAHAIGCAVIGYGEHLYITFASIASGTGVERAFFTRLRRMGITPRIETNLTHANRD